MLLLPKNVSDGHKLQVIWKGPFQVTAFNSAWVYKVRDLISAKDMFFHSNRLKFYADSSLNVTQTLLDTINHNEVHYNTVTKLLDLRYNRTTKQWEVQA